MDLRRKDIDILKDKYDLVFDQPWQVIDHFENIIAEFFGASYGVATDSNTHAVELALRLLDQPIGKIRMPKHTYPSLPMTLDKIGYDYEFVNDKWKDRYSLDPLPIVDGAVTWQQGSYTPGTFLCLSFQFKKQIPIGRGGMILLDDKEHYEKLKRMSHDGRSREIPWDQCDIKEIGYHYYMTPEDAARGIDIFHQVRELPPRQWSYLDYPDLTTFDYFKSRAYNN